MKLLYGTKNPAKLEAMRKRLEILDIEIIGFCSPECKEICKNIPDVPEKGMTPLENARQKAKAYYQAFGIPVFSCDSGLYIKELPDSLQPGVHVRTIDGNYLSDEEMLAYYSGLARQYGNLTARYQNAICLILDKNKVFESMADSLSSKPFLLTAVPHSMRKKGFPLDSLSLEIETGMYYYDRDPNQLDEVAVEDGFLEFFKECLKK